MVATFEMRNQWRGVGRMKERKRERAGREGEGERVVGGLWGMALGESVEGLHILVETRASILISFFISSIFSEVGNSVASCPAPLGPWQPSNGLNELWIASTNLQYPSLPLLLPIPSSPFSFVSSLTFVLSLLSLSYWAALSRPPSSSPSPPSLSHPLYCSPSPPSSLLCWLTPSMEQHEGISSHAAGQPVCSLVSA